MSDIDHLALESPTPDELKETLVFTPEHKMVSWARVADNPAANLHTAKLLMDNLLAKREELILEAVARQRGGKPPSLRAFCRYATIIKVETDGKPTVNHLLWRNRPCAAWTDPETSMAGSTYVLSWHFRSI